MNLIITLNPAQLFWFLPSGKCHLTSDAPGPIHVDFTTLTPDEQKCIILAGRSKTIDLSIHDTELVEVFNNSINPVAPPIFTPVVETPSKTLSDYVENQNELRNQLSNILNKSNSSIKKEIGLLDDPKSLKILLELETNGNNRFKTIECIKSRLEYIENAIISTISNDADESTELPSVDPIADNMEVVDSEVEIREIPLDGDE